MAPAPPFLFGISVREHFHTYRRWTPLVAGASGFASEVFCLRPRSGLKENGESASALGDAAGCLESVKRTTEQTYEPQDSAIRFTDCIYVSIPISPMNRWAIIIRRLRRLLSQSRRNLKIAIRSSVRRMVRVIPFCWNLSRLGKPLRSRHKDFVPWLRLEMR